MVTVIQPSNISTGDPVEETPHLPFFIEPLSSDTRFLFHGDHLYSRRSETSEQGLRNYRECIFFINSNPTSN